MPNLINRLLLLTNGGEDFFRNVFLSNKHSKQRSKTGKKSMARIGRKWKVPKSQTRLTGSFTTCTDVEEPSMSTHL